MRLSKRVIAREETGELVLPYEVQPFPVELSSAAKNFVKTQPGPGSGGFQIDPKLALQTGIAESERKSLEARVEKEVLQRLESVQEEAYKEAHRLGLDEGREKAYQEYREKFESNLASWDQLLQELESLKSTLAEQHERSLVQMLFHFASKIAHREIQAYPEQVTEIVKECVARSQGDEELRVFVSPSDFEFLKTAAQKTGRDQSFLKRVDLVQSEEITPGGCIVESNYGQIDATLETRVQKLWELLESQLPPARSQMKATE